MKVMMLNSLDGLRGGRRRGLGAVSDVAELKAQALDRFTARIEPMDILIGTLIDAAEGAAVPIADFDALSERYNSLADQVTARLHVLDVATTEGAVRAWESGSEELVAQVEAWVSDVRRIVGDERQRRGMKVAILTVGAIVLLGGGAYVLVKKYR